ncbi:helix-turn-helix domain-containing protein [Nocardia australiensis]|uniref:helix-turn-helix domain-containing protein n=1 Tax=Nocardia australiensis TaxID=2887191 RepID=UPI001D13888A|nr:helix-turn-helix domain-containing protein [Nocardia australiensis]
MPVRGPRREDEVRIARERLLEQGLLRAFVPKSLVAAEIEQSWRRSISHRVDPGAEPHVLGEIDPGSAILRAAGRILDQWQSNLTQSRLALFLADEDGRIVSRRIVAAQDERILDRANAAEGFDFSERSLGTNGLGTPLEAHGVVFVRGNEHFNDGLAKLACAGAPIKHPITGRIVGSLSLASHVDVSSPLMVAMVRQAGQEIAEALEHMADSRDLELARAYRRFRSARHSVLVMNSETVMTDLPSLAHLDAESHAVLWEKLRQHRWGDDILRLELTALGTEALVRRLGRGGQDAIFALEFTDPGGVEVTEQSAVIAAPQETTAPVVGGMLDALVAYKPSGSPYDPVQQRLTAAAAMDRLVCVVGEPGVGKHYQAAKWLREQTGQEPEVFTAPDVAEDGVFWDDAVAALHDRRGVIVDADSLCGEMRTRLVDFARRLPTDLHPDARIILTERRSATAGHDAETSGASTTVRIPPLAELRDELPSIVRDVSATLFPQAPAPRFSPAAFQCLLAWHWSGNVAELARLLALLPHVAAGGLIQTKDLPAPMCHTSTFSMSRYEQAERDAIVGALREAEGNKSRAAAILGLGRTTLYRKMRALQIDTHERMIAPGPRARTAPVPGGR